MFELFKPEYTERVKAFPEIATVYAHAISDAARFINETSGREYTPLSENHRL